MGQTYSVNLHVKFNDEQGAADALRSKIRRGPAERTDYNIDHYRSLGIGTDSVWDLLKIFFGGWEGKLEKAPGSKSRHTHLQSGFDACYGWEGVMMDAFDEIAPFLAPGSSIRIYPDSGCDYGKISNGKANWK